MPKALLLRIDGSTESVIVPDSLDDNIDEMLGLIDSEGFYLSTLAHDIDTDRTIFLLVDVYNDFYDERFGPKPPLNQFIQKFSKAEIYGNVLVYLSEPPEDGPGDDTIFDLNLTIDDLKTLMNSVMIDDRGNFSSFLYEVLDDPVKRKEVSQILKKVGIFKFTDEPEIEPTFDLPRH